MSIDDSNDRLALLVLYPEYLILSPPCYVNLQEKKTTLP
jgi:hypothetical protein